MAEPARRRGPYAKSAARRQEILRTAIEVFGESGYRGSSIREIAAHVGMTDTGVVHHFGGKVNLLLEVLKQRESEDRDDLEAAGADPYRRDLVAKNGRRPGVVRLFATLTAESTDPEHPAHEHFRNRYAVVRGALAARIREARAASAASAAPDDRPFDPDLAARITLAVMDGLQIQWLLDPQQDMSEAYNDFVSRYFGDRPRPVGPDRTRRTTAKTRATS